MDAKTSLLVPKERPPMSIVPSKPGSAGSLLRRLTLATLGASALTAPVAALAQPMSPQPMAPMTQAAAPAHTHMAHHMSYTMRRETLEQRISSLHMALKITPAEEADWAKVADVMRRNEAAMQKMVDESRAQVPHELNAVDDLKTYERFNQAHVDGLKDIIGSFATLYATMPEDQKRVADHVFAKFGHERMPMHGAVASHS